MLDPVINNPCHICGGQTRKVAPFAARDNELLFLHRCKSCRAESLVPQPSNDWLAQEYSDYYEKRSSLVERPRREFFRRILSKLPVDLNEKSVVDCGAGEGDSIAAIVESWPGARTTALEANAECQPYYNDLPCELVTTFLEDWLEAEHQQSFDVILLFDLLEHLREPKIVLGTLIHRHLSSGGFIVATFPNANSVTHDFMGKLWPQYKVEHLNYFSRHSVEILSGLVNVETVTLEPLKKYLPLDYMLAVGSNFGPARVQQLTRSARSSTPEFLRKMSISVPLGEWLWIARKPA
jgi:hypothetical protein